MKTELSSLEIRVLAGELECLSGARIQKVYQEKKMVHLSMHVPRGGTKTLIIGDGKIFLTKYRLKHSENPTSFAMYLRKYCRGLRIRRVFQHDFERIIIMDMDEYRLIIELFSRGNVIFADRDNRIWSVLERQTWSSRNIRQKEEYRFPPCGIDPTALTAQAFLKSLANSEKQIVAFLAREMSLGGTFAEEVCHLAETDKRKPCNTLTKAESLSVLSAIGSLFKSSKKPQIILENKEEIDVLPFDVKKYCGFEKKYYDTFYDAVDDFFVRKMAEVEEGTERKELTAKRDKLAKRYENQKSAIDKLKKEEADSVKSAELIYEHYVPFEKLMCAINERGLSEIKRYVKEIRSFDLKNKTVTVNVNGVDVVINILLTLNENANNYYEKAKKAREKAKSAEDALRVTEKKMNEAKETKEKTVRIEKKEDAGKWYHKFRWFVSSGGFLVVAGKDATSNEVLIKKHLDKDDVVFHTDITGSPFVVVKTENKEADGRTLEEAAQFAGIYSRAWKAKVGAAEVYHVKPEQVSKKAPSGEYITKGSFMIYGKKNAMKTELKLGIGFKEGRIFAGPSRSVALLTQKYVLVEPGDEKAPLLAKKVKAALFAMCSKSEQDILRKMSTDDIVRAIPFGCGRMA